MIRTVFIVVVVIHGLIHLMGFSKAFGYAELPQLTQPIPRPMGVLWLTAALLLLATAAAVLLWPRWWWILGALALLVSQVVILSSWSDAKFGTVANLVLLAGVLCGFASRGPHRANAISAELRFSELGELVDFISDDRLAGSPDGRTFTRLRWSTPLRGYAQVGPARVATRGEAVWHPASGAFAYGEFEIASLAYNVGSGLPR